jgi:hypothetical protein
MATTVSQAGSLEETLANIRNNPLYTQELKDYYLTTYAPGLTQATYNINAARNAFQANEGNRATQRGEAVRRIAGDYASRGMRTPSAVNRDRSRVQNEFANQSREEQARIAQMENERGVLYGESGQAQTGETFMNTPASFGSIGAGAGRSALAGLAGLPQQYGLLGVGAGAAPMYGDSSFGGYEQTPQPQPVTVPSRQLQSRTPPRTRVDTQPPVTAPRPNTRTRSTGSGMNRTYAI